MKTSILTAHRHSETSTRLRTASPKKKDVDWLEGYGVTHVAMESTGVYWKPILYLLEEVFTCLLLNAAQIAQVPGRKTDVKDCAWIAQLLEHGLVRGSFVRRRRSSVRGGWRWPESQWSWGQRQAEAAEAEVRKIPGMLIRLTPRRTASCRWWVRALP